MNNIPDKSIDMILADLPYGTTKCIWDIIIPFNDYIILEVRKKRRIFYRDDFLLWCYQQGETDYNGALVYFEENKSVGLWTQYERIIKDNGAIILFAKEPFTSDLVNSNKKLYKYELIWEKDKPTDFGLANRKPMCYHENIEVFYKNQPTYNKQMIEREGKGTWRYKFDINHDNRKIHGTDKIYSGKKNKENYDIKFKNPKSILYYDTGKRQHLLHPTQKPLDLCKWFIKTYTNLNNIVLDNCMGSGTTGVAALELDRKFIGIEKDEKIFNVGRNRIMEFVKKKNLI